MALDTKFVRGADRLARRIQTIRNNLHLPAMTEAIGELLLRRTKQRFDREVDPDERRWEALKDQTLRRKRTGGWGGEKMLVRTGKLRGSIKLIRGSVDGATFTNTGGGIRIGIEDPEIAAYARVHNRGFPAKKIPARQFLGVSRNDIKAVDGLLRRKAKQIEALE